jgi:hypothetical protein
MKGKDMLIIAVIVFCLFGMFLVSCMEHGPAYEEIENTVDETQDPDTNIYKLWRLRGDIEHNSNMSGSGSIHGSTGFLGGSIKGYSEIHGESVTETIISFYYIDKDSIMHREEYPALEVNFKIIKDKEEPYVRYIKYYDAIPNTVTVYCPERDFSSYINTNAL